MCTPGRRGGGCAENIFEIQNVDHRQSHLGKCGDNVVMGVVNGGGWCIV